MTAPPPWTLTGNGLVIVAHFPESFVRQHGFLEPYQRAAYRGWVGTVMLVDYQTSGVGPYGELLFIPGLFGFRHDWGKLLSFSISKIYVSTDDSVQNGRRNWGIPKEPADFRFTTEAGGHRHVVVSRSGTALLSLRAKPWGPRLPISTNWLPGFRVTQRTDPAFTTDDGYRLLLTRPSASGSARLARLSDVRVNPAYFPDFDRIRPLAVLSVENFRMTFPVPQIVPVRAGVGATGPDAPRVGERVIRERGRG